MVGEGATVVILVLYVFWLFRERGNRLEISVNIVTQLANSYLYTRARAVDAIRRHNQGRIWGTTDDKRSTNWSTSTTLWPRGWPDRMPPSRR